jgi:hypothetical protein
LNGRRSDLAQAETKKLRVSIATKVGHIFFECFASLEAVDTIVTDAG